MRKELKGWLRKWRDDIVERHHTAATQFHRDLATEELAIFDKEIVGTERQRKASMRRSAFARAFKKMGAI